jgi:hypothetical protein
MLSGAAACGTTHLVRPLGAGNTRVNLSVGGPFVRFGAPIPLPVSVLGVAHGVTDAVDVHGDLHPTALGFGVAGADVGLAVHPIPAARHALTIGGTIYGFSNREDAVVFADLWIGSIFRPTRWLALGGGLHNGLRIDTTDRELRERFPWAPTPFLYGALTFGRVGLELEFRWNVISANGYRATVNYYPVGEIGALGLLLGVTYQFPEGVR